MKALQKSSPKMVLMMMLNCQHQTLAWYSTHVPRHLLKYYISHKTVLVLKEYSLFCSLCHVSSLDSCIAIYFIHRGCNSKFMKQMECNREYHIYILDYQILHGFEVQRILTPDTMLRLLIVFASLENIRH